MSTPIPTLTGPCDGCPHPEVCLAGRPFCEKHGIAIVSVSPMLDNTEKMECLSVIVNWPLPTLDYAVASPFLFYLTRRIWEFVIQRPLDDVEVDGTDQTAAESSDRQEADRRHNAITSAASEAYILLQDRAASIEGDPGIVPFSAISAMLSALMAFHLVTSWTRAKRLSTNSRRGPLRLCRTSTRSRSIYSQVSPAMFDEARAAHAKAQTERAAQKVDQDLAAELADKFRKG